MRTCEVLWNKGIPPMINWDRVRTLREDVGADSFADVVEIFVEEMDELIAELRGSATDEEREMTFHSLKNGALNLGFGDLSDLCQTGEKQAASGTNDEALLGQVESTYKETLGAFHRDRARECEHI